MTKYPFPARSRTGKATRKRVIFGFGCFALAAAMVTSASSAPAEGPVLPVIPAVVPSAQPGPTDTEVNSLAAAEGISSAEARARLLAERRLPLLVNSARTHLGRSLGGIWVDNGRIKLGVVTPIGSALETRAGEVVAGVGLAGKVDIVPTARGEAELVTLQNELDQQLVTVNDGAPVTIDVEPHVQSSTVRLNIPSSPTAAQERFVTDVTNRYGHSVSKVAKPGPLVEQACVSARYCDPPLRGGIRTHFSNTAGIAQCSGGFIVRSLVDDKRYLSTAGHCTKLGPETWSTRFSDMVLHNIGPRHNVGGGASDFGIVRINNPTGWNPKPIIRTSSDEMYPIYGFGPSVVGTAACFTGGTTDFNCGRVTGGLATRDGKLHTYRASYCTQAGDSGGSVFASNNVRGSHIGEMAECDVVYFSVEKFSLLNVVPEFSTP